MSGFYDLYAACPNVTVTSSSNQPNLQVQSITLPPQFTDMRIECNTITNELCTTSLNVTDSTVVLDTTIAGEYTKLNDYNFLRSNRSIFPTFDNELIVTSTIINFASRFGTAVAISGDGAILAISSTNYDTFQRVEMYQRKGNTWILQQLLTLPAAGFQGFGASLSLSYDGSILAVGATTAGPTVSIFPSPFVGIFMYQYNSTTNRYTLIQTINGGPLSALANSIQLSATGQHLIVSNDYNRSTNADSVFNPSARIYTRVAICPDSCIQEALWELQADLHLTTTTGVFLPGFTSSAVSGVPCQYVTISGDGNTAAFSWPRIDQSLVPGIAGAVTIFKRTGSSWQQTQLLWQSTLGFGTSVSLSNDGSYLAVGSSPSGASNLIYVFSLHGTQYIQEAAFTIQKFGPSTKVSLSADGSVLVIGTGNPTIFGASSGSVAIAVRGSNNRWSLPYFISTASGTSFGSGIGCSADGAFVIAGEPQLTPGAVHIYRPVGSFVPNDTVVTGSLCVYNRTTIDSTLRVQGNIHLNGTIVTGTAGQVTACTTNLSDKRIKTDITPLSHEDIRAQLHALQPVTFDWLLLRPWGFEEQALLRSQQAPLFEATESYEGQAPLRSHQVGFIAQQIEKIFPHWVSTMPAMEEQAQLIDDGQVKMITIKPELYAYLVAALEYLVQKNNRRNEELMNTH